MISMKDKITELKTQFMEMDFFAVSAFSYFINIFLDIHDVGDILMQVRYASR